MYCKIDTLFGIESTRKAQLRQEDTDTPPRDSVHIKFIMYFNNNFSFKSRFCIVLCELLCEIHKISIQTSFHPNKGPNMIQFI
jgi:hypothetical protein